MLITALVLSATLLGATTIAGLLMLYQLRQGSDIANSTKAIFAADAGLEWRLYRYLKIDKACNPSCDGSGTGDCPQPAFDNGATLKTSCAFQDSATGQAVVLHSTGLVQNDARAFEFSFTSGK